MFVRQVLAVAMAFVGYVGQADDRQTWCFDVEDCFVPQCLKIGNARLTPELLY